MNMTAWQRVELSRRKDRPVGSDYIDAHFTDFVEFHGDRYFADDKAIIGGVARFHGTPGTVIAQAKGRNTKENIERNFGMPQPEGYRKALRLMKQAEKFSRPVICLVDTPGAFCGLEAEERGQGEAIARNIYEMSGLRVCDLRYFNRTVFFQRFLSCKSHQYRLQSVHNAKRCVCIIFDCFNEALDLFCISCHVTLQEEI